MVCRTQVYLCIAACTFPHALALGLISPKLASPSYPPPHKVQPPIITAQGNLAFIHVPYNFGHTIEGAAFFRKDTPYPDMVQFVESLGGIGDATRQASWEETAEWLRPGGEIWGHFNPLLQQESEVTGCSLFYTPPKYWPQDIAEKYIGNRTTFGILRDPTERLVAMFRGNFKEYGGSLQQYFETCDVDRAVKSMAADILDKKDQYGTGCTRIPQAEYFEGPYGIKLVVDNRGIPDNINEVLETNGYTTDDWNIPVDKVLHVSGCNEVGTWNLTAETKAMVRKAFSKDYELLCRVFNYCSEGEDTCIVNVPEMCPSWVDKSRIEIHSTIRIQHLTT